MRDMFFRSSIAFGKDRLSQKVYMQVDCAQCKLVDVLTEAIKSKNAALKSQRRALKSKDQLIERQRKMLEELLLKNQTKIEFEFSIN